ncbi:MAG TPA: ATP-dependent zinc metalloprotease FtsH [Candidatus Paceibacterota bacterium]|nr:ATP-dependent zinc metalloprotease FtsH [Candidatus Paceibacterota bacterium]HOL54088.1 ATP-dependent zinc metalloprotease FtsH [Candidatus Paceibacterota bacterium]HON21807.1 ATP-dependent zinc metalloprotease FtsH [Candidatus Paceibacterota bacterium]HPP17132.1 ATP-dependent zinc metalloprotease FtsH [Candidatus Paceibacterota bacterium]
MKNLLKNIGIGILVFLILSTIFSYLWTGTEVNQKQQVSLNELVLKIKNGEVKSMVISDPEVRATTQDNKILITNKETGVSIIETLKNLGVTEEDLSKVQIDIKTPSDWLLWGALILQMVLPLALIFIFFMWMNKQAQKSVGQAFTFGKVNLKISSPKDKVTFRDVAGLEEAKQELMEVVEFLKNPKKFLDVGAKIPRGVLLMGPPGSGKTLLARAVAGEAGVPFFHISGAEFVELFVGVGASRVRDAFATAKRAAPSILFIDEIDAVGRERGAGLGGGHDEREQTLNQILVEMDGFDRDTNVIVMAATNRPDVLDPALLRPGRFDRRIILDLPDLREREEILKIHCRDKVLAKDVDLRRVAERTPGFSGADLANLVNEAAILAARRNKKEISQSEFLESIEKVILGPERKSRIISDKEKHIIAYHESGHALVTYFSPDADPVQKVSIIARGQAGGYTLKMPLEDRRLQTRKQFLAELAILLGGYTAEKIYLGDISTGAANDLKEASELARKLVTQFGMSDKLGPITFGKTEEMIFLGREISTEKNYSEETAEKIDKEVTRLIKDAQKRAEKLLKEYKNQMDVLVKTLLEKEVLEKEEFEKLMKESTEADKPAKNK